MRQLLEALGQDGVALISGVLVQLLTSAARATVLRNAWERWGWLARVATVAFVAALFAGLSGWAAELAGWALVKHVAQAFFVALGWRQVFKRIVRTLLPPSPIELPPDTSLRTRAPEPHR